MSDAIPILSVQNVTKKFGGIAAVSDVSFDVQAGTICGLVGPNGAGKTTLVNVLSGFEPSTSGQVRLGERSISGWSATRRARAGLVRTFQHAHTFGSMRVGEALAAASVPPRGTGVRALFPSRDRQEITDRVAEALQFLQLTRWEDALCGDLPYGVKKRLGIGLSLVTEPKVLLLDEPAAGLNTVETSDLVEMLRELRSTGITILVIEHSMPLIRSVCDSMVVLDHGVKIHEGPPDVVLSDERVIGAYLGRR